MSVFCVLHFSSLLSMLKKPELVSQKRANIEFYKLLDPSCKKLIGFRGVGRTLGKQSSGGVM